MSGVQVLEDVQLLGPGTHTMCTIWLISLDYKDNVILAICTIRYPPFDNLTLFDLFLSTQKVFGLGVLRDQV